MATWGDADLQIRWGTYYPPHAEAGLVSIRVLPPDTGTDHVEVVQQGGRDRKVITFEGQCWSLPEYDVLLDAYIAGEEKLFNGPDVTNFPCFIKQLSPPEYVIDYEGQGYYRYSIILCECEIEGEEE